METHVASQNRAKGSFKRYFKIHHINVTNLIWWYLLLHFKSNSYNSVRILSTFFDSTLVTLIPFSFAHAKRDKFSKNTEAHMLNQTLRREITKMRWAAGGRAAMDSDQWWWLHDEETERLTICNSKKLWLLNLRCLYFHRTRPHLTK